MQITDLIATFKSRLDDLYYEIRNRFFAKYYLIDIKAMPRGAWMDCDYKLFHVVFQILVDHVEGELSHLSKIMNDASEDLDVVAWNRASWVDRWWNRQHWNERLGMATLRAAVDLADPSLPEEQRFVEQAAAATRLLALYKWYKWERPCRDIDIKQAKFDGVCYVDQNGNPADDGWSWDLVTHTPRSTMRTPEYDAWCTAHWKRMDDAELEDTRNAQEVIELRGALWT